MPPTNPWGKKSQQLKPTSSGFPDLKPGKPVPSTPVSPAPQSQYEEIQNDELFALASIYGEDFQRIESNTGAWKVCDIYSFLQKHFI
jgi:translation initiation factor 2-alpha kinase 4